MGDIKKPDPKWLGGNEQARETVAIADVISVGLSTSVGNNKNSITVNLGVGYTGESYSKDAMLFSPPGLLSVPMGPGFVDSNSNGGDFVPSNTSMESAQAAYIVRNDKHIVLGIRDTRTQFAAGNLKEGETCVYAPASSARTTYKQDGSINHITQAANGSAVIQQITPTSWSFFAPWGKFIFDETGLHISLTTGAQFHMGGLNAPGPLAGLSSFISMSAGMVSIPAATVNLGLAGPKGYSQTLFATIPEPPGVMQVVGPVTIPFTPSQSIFVGA